MNTVTFTGNTMDEPEFRVTQSGRTVASFPLAVNRSYTKQDGTKVENMTKYQVSVWGQPAENVAESVGKGARVVVQGYLEMENWTDRDGNTRTTPRITASEVALSLRYAKVGQVTKSSSQAARPSGQTPDADHFGSAPKVNDEDIPF